MTSPLQRPEGHEHARSSPQRVSPAPAAAAPRRLWIERLFPADSLVAAAALACVALLGLALKQFAFTWPGLERAAETYRYASMALVALWGGAGLLRRLAGRRGKGALEIGLCVAGFLAWQMLLPGFMSDVTRNLPPAIPAEAYVTATPTPIPSATPLPSRLIGVARMDGLDVRDGPGTEYRSIARLNRGNMLEVNGRDEHAEWVHVAYPDGRTGWVAREFMDLHDANNRLSEPLGLPVLPAPTLAP